MSRFASGIAIEDGAQAAYRVLALCLGHDGADLEKADPRERGRWQAVASTIYDFEQDGVELPVSKVAEALAGIHSGDISYESGKPVRSWAGWAEMPQMSKYAWEAVARHLWDMAINADADDSIDEESWREWMVQRAAHKGPAVVAVKEAAPGKNRKKWRKA